MKDESIIARTMTDNELTPRPNTQYSEGNMPDGNEEREQRNSRPPSGGERTGASKRREKQIEDLRKKVDELEEERKKNQEGDSELLVGLRSLLQELLNTSDQPQATVQEPRSESRPSGVLSVENAVSGVDEAGRAFFANARVDPLEDGGIDPSEINPDKDALNIFKREIASISPQNIAEVATAFGEGGNFLKHLNASVYGYKDNKLVLKVSQEQYEESLQRAEKVRALAASGRVNEAKEEAFNAIEHVRYLRDRYVSKERIDVNSIEQLAQLIITTDPELWGEKYRLLDKEGNINQANFLHWVRESMLWHHDNDSDNPSLNFWSLIEVSTPYRNINLATMLRQRGKFFRTRDGIELDELREQITREVWLFNTSRNNHLQYRASMFKGDKLTEAINQMFYTNTFTKNAFGKSTLRWIMTMPENFLASRAQSTQARREGNPDANVGEGIRTAFFAYYHLSDIDTLEKFLGKDAPLLQREAYEKFIIENEMSRFKSEWVLQGKDVTSRKELESMGMSTDTEFVRESEKRREELTALIKTQSTTQTSKEIQARWLSSSEGGKEFYLDALFNEDGTPKKDTFSAFINIFTGPETNNQNTKVVREMIRQSIANKYKKGADEDLRDEEFGMPKYAEAWAYSMTRWTGVGARNDTGARSYDKWTELLHTRLKRKRDTAGTRGGGAGNPYSFGLFNQLSPDLFNGLVLQHDKSTSPYQLLWAIEEAKARGEDVNIHNRLETLEFTDNAMGQFASVHLANAFTLLDTIMDAQELDFEKYTTIDKFGRRIFDQAAYQEGLGKFFKTIRNAYSTWSQINFAAEVRSLQANTKPPTYKTMTLAEAMFGKQILDIPEFKRNGKFDANLIHEEIVVGRDKKTGKVEKRDGREILYKQIIKAFIAAQVYAHRDLKSNYKHYDFHAIETIYEALEQIPADIIEDPDDLTKTKITGHYFNHDDMKWIRKKSKTGTKRMFWSEFGVLGTAGLFSGLKEALEQIKESVKTK